ATTTGSRERASATAAKISEARASRADARRSVELEHLIELGEQMLVRGQLGGAASRGRLGGGADGRVGVRGERGGERGRVADGDQRGGVPGDPTGAARVGRDDRASGEQSLLEGDGLALPAGG